MVTFNTSTSDESYIVIRVDLKVLLRILDLTIRLVGNVIKSASSSNEGTNNGKINKIYYYHYIRYSINFTDLEQLLQNSLDGRVILIKCQQDNLQINRSKLVSIVIPK